MEWPAHPPLEVGGGVSVKGIGMCLNVYITKNK